MGTMFSAIVNTVAASRFIYSFARDSGFPPPFNAYLKKVDPLTGAPTPAICLFVSGIIMFCISWTNKSPQVAFNAVSGINSIGFLMCYGTPLLLRFTTALKTFKATSDFNLGIFSIPCAVLGMLYGLFSVGTISMPNLYPNSGHPNNVNFAPVAFAATLIFAGILFPIALSWPRWGYKGPALVAQASRHKEAIGPEESVRAGVFPGDEKAGGEGAPPAELELESRAI